MVAVCTWAIATWRRWHVAVEGGVALLAAKYADQIFGEVDGIVDPAVHAHGADRAVKMRAVARQQDAALAEGRSDALGYGVAIIERDIVAVRTRIEALQLALRSFERAVAVKRLVRAHRRDEAVDAGRPLP